MTLIAGSRALGMAWRQTMRARGTPLSVAMRTKSLAITSITLERTVRRIWAVITMVSTATGSTMPGKKSPTGAPGAASTIPGTQPRPILKMKIKMVAETNSGIVIARMPPVDSRMSSTPSRLRPVSTPSNRASGMPTPRVQPASSSVLRKRSPSRIAIGLPLPAETPRSPRSAPAAHPA